jgi:hypothetical protein
MASDDEDECGYFYDEDDAEEDAAAGLEEDAAPPPERRADCWVSGSRPKPGGTGGSANARLTFFGFPASARSGRDLAADRFGSPPLPLRTPIR